MKFGVTLSVRRQRGVHTASYQQRLDELTGRLFKLVSSLANQINIHLSC